MQFVYTQKAEFYIVYELYASILYIALSELLISQRMCFLNESREATDACWFGS